MLSGAIMGFGLGVGSLISLLIKWLILHFLLRLLGIKGIVALLIVLAIWAVYTYFKRNRYRRR